MAFFYKNLQYYVFFIKKKNNPMDPVFFFKFHVVNFFLCISFEVQIMQFILKINSCDIF